MREQTTRELKIADILLVFCCTIFGEICLSNIYRCNLEQLIRALESQKFGECDPKLARMKRHSFGVDSWICFSGDFFGECA